MRLTEKDITYITSSANVIEIPDIVESRKYTGQAIIKLGQLEDIEEEFGIDLITLFKALKDGIWIKQTIIDKGEIKNLFFFYEDVNLYKDCLYACPVDIYDKRVSVYHYGKTWALTREELL